ncbi:MAG: hypothetical protein Q7T82_08970 [Armatimonadota bacterium]|nr:hypothetical protein [Armatimonadota bacterium]
MWHSYKILIVAVGILLPYFLFAYRNRFNNINLTLGRAGIAVIVGWAFILFSTLLVTDIDLKLARTEREIQAICDGDGGRNVGALLFGWFYPFAMVIFYWTAHKFIAALKRA